MVSSLANPYRVLDLTDEKGYPCGRLLGDLGADVIKVEKPGGDHARRSDPFYWYAYNMNKRGITLDIENTSGREIFSELAKKADFVIESFQPGFMDRLNVGYSDLMKLNDRIILVSITPFGQSGPYKDYKGSNIVVEGMGGLMYIIGDLGQTPFSSGFQYAFKIAGLQAAVAALMANYWRQRSGKGQHVDVSIQESVLVTLYPTQHLWDSEKVVQGRFGVKYLREGGMTVQLVYRCKDGYVLWRVLTAQLGWATRALSQWMSEEGVANELTKVNWESTDLAKISQQQLEGWESVFAGFFLKKTRQELYTETINRNLMIFPVNEVYDILKDPQLEERGFWINVEHPESDRLVACAGIPFKCEGIAFNMKRPPSIGENNDEIYCEELGLARNELGSLKRKRAI